MQSPVLILASSSPRRRELLGLFGLPFDVRHANVDERPHPGESPGAMTERLASAKASAVAADWPDHWVLGGDTTVSLDGRILGKPANRADAASMLACLSGRSHEVISAVTLLGPGFQDAHRSRSIVDFMTLSPAMIESYCDSGEPFDKAGGYGIQGPAGTFVKSIHGSYSGIVGLPLYETRLLLQRAALL